MTRHTQTPPRSMRWALRSSAPSWLARASRRRSARPAPAVRPDDERNDGLTRWFAAPTTALRCEWNTAPRKCRPSPVPPSSGSAVLNWRPTSWPANSPHPPDFPSRPPSTSARTKPRRAPAAEPEWHFSYTYTISQTATISQMSRTARFLRSFLPIVARGRAGKQFAAIGQLDANRIRQITAILGEEAIDDNPIPDMHGIPRPSHPLQDIRAAHFQLPVPDLTPCIFHIDIEAGMRVHPLDFCHRPGHDNGLV